MTRLLRQVVAVVRMARLLAHALAGLWTLHYRFGSMAVAQQQMAVQRWAQGVLRIMGIGLQDGSLREFKAGEHFYSADHLPAGAMFDAALHGHWSCQIGDEPLVTLFVRG